MTLLIPRRAVIGGLAGLIAAPAVVRASSLMPVRALPAAAAPALSGLGFEAAVEGGWFGVPGWWDLGDAIARLQGAPAGAGRLLA